MKKFIIYLFVTLFTCGLFSSISSVNYAMMQEDTSGFASAADTSKESGMDDMFYEAVDDDTETTPANETNNNTLLYLIIAGVVLSCLHQSSLGTLMIIAGSKIHPLWQTPVLPLSSNRTVLLKYATTFLP